ncbi:YheC/YheD family protein [Paenibacillus sp. AR247]|uniref:YheC/YheD family protein n=1 Tax=Paenibacillus sp. AR247 TaxID=1631599 RepID=UPI002157FAD4|nr:YheC/YheD family protein [Paenibacillus sp. AR247]
MAKYKSSSISDKWKKTNWLLEQGDLRKHVPHTEPFDRKNLFSMLSKYSTVYFKPTHGSGGAGIIRINKKTMDTKPNSRKRNPSFQQLTSYIICFPAFLTKGRICYRRGSN